MGASAEPHLFEAIASEEKWLDWDEAFAKCITRSVLQDAVDTVPASFLLPLLPKAESAERMAQSEDALRRRRAAYVAYLWRRLKAPRAFATHPPVLLASNPRGKPPRWVKAVESR